jgi:hypothetical protein
MSSHPRYTYSDYVSNLAHTCDTTTTKCSGCKHISSELEFLEDELKSLLHTFNNAVLLDNKVQYGLVEQMHLITVTINKLRNTLEQK